MLLVIPEQVIKRMQSRAKSPVIKASRAWSNETFDHLDLDPADLPLIAEFSEGLTGTNEDARRLLRRLKQLEKVGKGHRHRNLELLADEMRAVVQGLPHHWVFVENDDAKDTLDPYVVTSIVYVPPKNHRDYYEPAHINVAASAIRRGKTRGVNGSITRDDLPQDTNAESLLASQGFLPETPELVKTYEDSCERYGSLRQREGIQLVGTGTTILESSDEDSWWGSRLKRTELGRDGKPGRVVLDDKEKWEDKRGAVTISKNLRGVQDENDEEDGKAEAVKLPEHPYLRLFDMRTHTYGTTHVDNVSEYIYNRTAFDRVILPGDTKELIDALVMSGNEGDDIVEGKGKGTVILSSGPPGTGKTLTAEAYAERARRPLYPVQCSQLGLEPEELEKELATVLERAMRWGAILLLDEADVYIRTRGDDIRQNAVVGVFLRLLEYYSGVLFMTTNRDTMVDDAILSRCIVHIKYKIPAPDEAKEIWEIMFTQFVLKDEHGGRLRDGHRKTIGELVKLYAGISGRTMKQMARLARTISDRLKRPCDLEAFKWVARYQDLEKTKGLNSPVTERDK